MRLFARALLTALLLVPLPGLILFAPLPARAADITVFAAASLAETMNRLADDYQKQSGKTVAVSLAASSVLARQIEASGGADLFVSADEEWMDYLDKKNLLAASTRKDLLGNRLVLIGPANAPGIALTRGFDLRGALKGGRLAIADPATVSAGKYGREALTALAAWEGVSLAPAENVRVALAYVARGEAPLGVVYETDAKAEQRVTVVAIFPAASHAPIRYPAALTKDAKPEARGFLDYLSSPAARTVFTQAGFTVLGR